MNINFYPSTFCYLNLLTNDGSWYGQMGCRFEENLAEARGYEQDSKYEWAITARKSGEWIVIAQSKNWRDREGENIKIDTFASNPTDSEATSDASGEA